MEGSMNSKLDEMESLTDIVLGDNARLFVDFMKDCLSVMGHEENHVIFLCRWITLLCKLHKNVEEIYSFCSSRKNPQLIEKIINCLEEMANKFKSLGEKLGSHHPETASVNGPSVFERLDKTDEDYHDCLQLNMRDLITLLKDSTLQKSRKSENHVSTQTDFDQPEFDLQSETDLELVGAAMAVLPDPSEYCVENQFEMEKINYIHQSPSFVHTIYSGPNMGFYGSQSVSTGTGTYYPGMSGFSNVSPQYPTAIQPCVPGRNMNAPVFLPRYFSTSPSPSSSFFIPQSNHQFSYSNVSPNVPVSYETSSSLKKSSRYNARLNSAESDVMELSHCREGFGTRDWKRKTQRDCSPNRDKRSSSRKKCLKYESCTLEVDRIERLYHPSPIRSNPKDMEEEKLSNTSIYHTTPCESRRSSSPEDKFPALVPKITDSILKPSELMDIVINKDSQKTIIPKTITLVNSKLKDHSRPSEIKPFEGKLSFVKVLTGDTNIDKKQWTPPGFEVKCETANSGSSGTELSKSCPKIQMKSKKSRRPVPASNPRPAQCNKPDMKSRTFFSKRPSFQLNDDNALPPALFTKKFGKENNQHFDSSKRTNSSKSRKSLKPLTDKDGWTHVPSRLRTEDTEAKPDEKELSCQTKNDHDGSFINNHFNEEEEMSNFLLFGVQNEIYTSSGSNSSDGKSIDSQTKCVSNGLNNFSLSSEKESLSSGLKKITNNFFMCSSMQSSPEGLSSPSLSPTEGVVVGINTKLNSTSLDDFLNSEEFLSYNKSDVTGLIQSSISSWSDVKGEGDSEDQHFNDEDVRKSLALEEEALMLTKKIKDLESNDADVFGETESEYDNNSDNIDPHEIFAEYSQYISQMSSIGDQMVEMKRFQEMLSSDPDDAIFTYKYGSIEQFQELVARFPTKAVELHCKLLGRSKRTNSDEIYENRQKKAEEKRQQILNLKAAKMRELLQRVEEVRQAQLQIIEERKCRINEKLKRAEENRISYLNTIKKKAHDEEEKLKEIAFINELEAQNRRHDSLALRQEQEERIQTIMEERQRKVDEKAAKEAAVGERKRVLEAERQEKIELMQKKRRQKEEIIGKKQQEKEMERKVTALEKAREREERLLAREAAHIATVKELQDKILKKQESTARRHEENIQHIRQKALEAGMFRSAASDEVTDGSKKTGSSDSKKNSSSQEQTECRSKAHKKKYKKIRSRLLKSNLDFDEVRQSLVIQNMDPDTAVSLKKKLCRAYEIICDQFTSYLDGPTFSDLESVLNDITELVNANEFCRKNFHTLKGFEIFYNVLLRLTNSTRTACFNRLAKKMCSIFLVVCQYSYENCGAFVMGNTICELMESLNMLLADLLYSKTKQGNLTVEITGLIITLLRTALGGVRMCEDIQNQRSDLVRRIKDVISFMVCSGLMHKFIDILKFTTQQESDKGYPFGPLLDPLLKLLTEIVHPPLFTDEFKDLLEKTDLLGTVTLLYGHLQHSHQPLPAFTENIILFFKEVGSLHLTLFQKILGAEGISLQFRYIASSILNICSASNDPEYHAILNYTILLIGYFSARNLDNQVILQSGQMPTVLQQLLSLPFRYFCDPSLQGVLYPTLIALCDDNPTNRLLLENEMSYDHISFFIKKKMENSDCTTPASDSDTKIYTSKDKRHSVSVIAVTTDASSKVQMEKITSSSEKSQIQSITVTDVSSKVQDHTEILEEISKSIPIKAVATSGQVVGDEKTSPEGNSKCTSMTAATGQAQEDIKGCERKSHSKSIKNVAAACQTQDDEETSSAKEKSQPSFIIAAVATHLDGDCGVSSSSDDSSESTMTAASAGTSEDEESSSDEIL